jgi:hypothetical protein
VNGLEGKGGWGMGQGENVCGHGGWSGGRGERGGGEGRGHRLVGFAALQAQIMLATQLGLVPCTRNNQPCTIHGQRLCSAGVMLAARHPAPLMV